MRPVGPKVTGEQKPRLGEADDAFGDELHHGEQSVAVLHVQRDGVTSADVVVWHVLRAGGVHGRVVRVSAALADELELVGASVHVGDDGVWDGATVSSGCGRTSAGSKRVGSVVVHEVLSSRLYVTDHVRSCMSRNLVEERGGECIVVVRIFSQAVAELGHVATGAAGPAITIAALWVAHHVNPRRRSRIVLVHCATRGSRRVAGVLLGVRQIMRLVVSHVAVHRCGAVEVWRRSRSVERASAWVWARASTPLFTESWARALFDRSTVALRVVAMVVLARVAADTLTLHVVPAERAAFEAWITTPSVGW